MPKRAILVAGPESSGTRMMTKILMAAGCAGDDDSHQRWDHEDPQGDLIVWRRSVPHARGWPVLRELVRHLRTFGYEVSALITTRAWWPMAQSQVFHHHVPDMATALVNIAGAYPHILAGLTAASVPYTMAHYENIVTRPDKALATLLGALGLKAPIGFEVFDANEKWYGGSA